jgi:hypothetical protein
MVMALFEMGYNNECMENCMRMERLVEVNKIGHCVRFEVFMAVTMKYGVFWDVTLCGSCKNRRFAGT